MSWMDSSSAGPERSWVSVPNRSFRPGRTLSRIPAKCTVSTTTTAVSTFAQPGTRPGRRLMGVVMVTALLPSDRMPPTSRNRHGS
ncbi:hypothetical protein SHIRM173S_04883 [Streptomyces hirsutus]